MALHRIKLTRSAAANVNYTYYGAYRLRIEASDAEGPDLDKYIFVYKRDPASPYTGKNCDPFCAVAGPDQMASVPPVDPDPDNNWPFYRLDYVELDFPSQAQAEEAWELIQQEVCILIEGLGKLAELKTEEVVWCPSPPEDDTAESESLSESEST